MDQRLRVPRTVVGLIAFAAHAAAGDLDLSFGASGKVIAVVGGGGSASALAIQPDGKIVAVGRSGAGDFALVRYNAAGALDSTFGAGGIVTTDIGPFDNASAVAIQADGKIVAAGTTAPAGFCCQFALARYNPNGSLDATFGTGGVVTTVFGGDSGASAVTIQADGKIVAAGGTMTPFVGSFALARYNPNGTLDSGFGAGGTVTTDLGGSDLASGVAILSDGRIVAVGRGGPSDDFALARYNTDGSLDATFGTAGMVTTDFGGNDQARGVALQPNGMIVVAGTGGFFQRFALARYATNGGLDPGFEGDGKVTTQFTGDNIESANGIAIQADGRIVAAGFAFSGPTQKFAIARFLSGGGPDASFGPLGKVMTVFPDGSAEALAVALQADGKIVAAGGGGPCTPHCEFTLARYLQVAAPAAPVTLTINITPGPNNGNVSVIPTGNLCSSTTQCVFNITAGTALRIVANSPATPGVISGGTGDASACATSTCLFTINNNSSINVTFTLGSYPSISLALAGDGTGEVGTDQNRCQNFELEATPCASFYAAGSTVTLEGRSMPGNLFVNFSGGTGGAASCSTTPCVFTLMGSATVTANFAALASVAVSPPMATREAGQTQFYSATGTFTNSGTRSLSTSFGTWLNKTQMAVTRFSSVGVGLGQRFYVFGGGVANGPPSARLDSYNPITGSWTLLQAMPTAHTEFAGAALGGQIYAVGGHTAGGAAVTTVEAYDPGGNTWAAKAPLPAPRASLAVVSFGGFLYAVGGDPNIGGQNILPPVASLDRYTPGSPGSWTAMASMPTARTQLVAAAAGGKLYVMGGNTGSGTSGAVEEYDPVTNTWTSKATLSPPKAFLSATTLNGLIYALTLDSTEVYNPATDTWTSLSGMKTPRNQFAVDVLDGRLWVAGGLLSPAMTVQSNTLEAFRPSETIWWSGNNAVATINQSGTASALSVGSATISARVGAIDCSPSAGCATLTVTAPTTIATTAGFSGVTTSGAILGGSVSTTGGPSITERGVVFSVHSVNSSPTVGGFNVTKVTTSGTTGPFSITVTGLTAATKYVYRAYATTNQTTYGAPLQFTTSSPPSRVFVSPTGNDSNDCAVQTTPCRNLAAAITQVAADGEVIIVSTGEYETAPLVINKGVRINSPSGTVAYIRQPITVNAPSARVVLRGLSIKGAGMLSGVTLQSANSLSIEDSTLDLWDRGLDLQNGSAAAVSITNSAFLSNQKAVWDGGPSGNRVSVSDSRFEKNDNGLIVATGSFFVRQSVFSASTTAIAVSGGSAEVRQSEFWGNQTALQATGGASRISRSHVFGNTNGLSQSGGVLASSGTNVIRGNTTNTSGTITTFAEQ